MSDVEAAPASAPAAVAPRASACGLGTFAFAMSFFVLNLLLAGAFGTDASTNLVFGLAIFYGGVAQFIAGLLEFKAGDAFAGTAFISYAAFFLSFAAFSFNGSNGVAAYGAKAGHAMGTYFILWGFFTLILLLASLRRHLGLVVFLFLVFLAFLLLSIGAFVSNSGSTTAGAIIGIIASVVAWYNGMTEFINKDTSYFALPYGRNPHRPV
ncbi:uncharacterized protein VTP21DRAFT_3786 [Calcarisporiella thermophila]|uniref:uncharacterized protein n=1 Tax=Calcarisporiella thermophila TaxID=911321 RepID=UPI0037434B69